MSSIQRKALVVLTVALLTALCSTTLAFAQSAVWTVTSSPNEGTSNNQLLGVGTVSASDIWAVGYWSPGPYLNTLRTLGEHWNGSSWSIVSTPNPLTGSEDYDQLEHVATFSTSNVWAVGYSGNVDSAADQALIEHWNGTAWSVVSGANPYTTQDLFGVAGVASNDIWAVGQYTNYNPYDQNGALIEHWNGTAWSSVANPATGALYSVVAVASNNVWAVGGSEILHWNGKKWALVSGAQAPNGAAYVLNTVTAISATNLWAVGYVANDYGTSTLIEQWNGSSWTRVYGVEPYAGADELFGVTALSSSGIWAVGVTVGQSFVEMWNGTQWTRMSSPNVGTSNNTFQGVAAVPATGDIWAVGVYYQANSPYQAQSLAEQCLAC